MTVTMFLLGLLYVVLVVTLLAVGANGITVAIIAGGLAALNLFASDKLALAAMGARVVSPQEAPQLHAMVERLCVQADLPKPKVAVANTRMPNAFALGRSPKSATVCATTGIMELLSPAELEGVMAHELTHVANRDVLVMTLAGFFATIAAYIVQFGFFFGGGGYGDRILAAVFSFRDERGRALYWIYNYKRGAFYPFVPSGGEQQRDSERELQLKAQIGSELPVEAELERWFPLWGIPV